MDSKFTGWLTGLMVSVGVSPDSEKLAELKEKLAEFDFDEDTQTKINLNVLNKEAAKNNQEIYKHAVAKYRANFGDKIDAQMYKALEEAGFSPEDVQAFKEEFKDNTIEAVSGLANRLKEKSLNDSPKGAGKEEINKLKESYQQKIDELNKSVLSKQEEISTIKQAHENELIGMEQSGILSSMEYSNKYDKNHALIVANTLVKDQLAKDNVRLVRDNQGISLKVNDETGSDFYLNNQKVTAQDYFKNILSKNNLLAAQTTPNVETVTNNTATAPKGVEQIVQSIDQALASAT